MANGKNNGACFHFGQINVLYWTTVLLDWCDNIYQLLLKNKLKNWRVLTH